VNSGGMGFFKPTKRKVVIAIIFTLFPYAISFALVLLRRGNIFSDNLEQLAFWIAVWSPVFLIAKIIPHSYYYSFWQSKAFLFYGYPILSFLFWFLVSSTIVFLLRSGKREKKGTVRQNTH
jgi:hypothetical protein